MTLPKRLLVAAAVVGVTLVGSVAAWRSLHEAPPVSPGALPMEFRVQPGERFQSVAGRLEEKGLIVSAWRLRVLARLEGMDRHIRAGTYVFDPGLSSAAVLEALVSGRVRLLKFTVPEGWRLVQIAEEAERVLGVSADAFRAAAETHPLLDDLPDAVGNLEGYLYPDTYHFPDGAAAEEVVDSMVRRFGEIWGTLDVAAAGKMSRHEVATLASIVEAETGVASERARIAAVYLNRLRDGWRLQADPTVRYALGRFHGRLYYKHLDVESPYNTYRTHGLPPGPICSPGEEALAAVLDPLVPCEDFFFVASGEGGHIFSRTKAEHDRARARVRSRSQ